MVFVAFRFDSFCAAYGSVDLAVGGSPLEGGFSRTVPVCMLVPERHAAEERSFDYYQSNL